MKEMKEKPECYSSYEKLLKMEPEQSIAETVEYEALAQTYPHLAESIKLKKEIERLKNKLKSEKKRSAKIQIKREINEVKAQLRKEQVLKRLRGESKQEAIFRMHFAIDTSKEHISLSAKRCQLTLSTAHRKARKKLRTSIYRCLPPSVFDLRSLDTTEKSQALIEWIHSRRKKRR